MKPVNKKYVEKIQRKYGKDVIVHWEDKKRYWGMPISFTHYSVVEKPGLWYKLFVKHGVFSTHIEEIHMYRIIDFSVYISLVNKIFGVGSIDIVCKDASSESIVLRKILFPHKVHALISDIVEREKRDKKMYFGEVQNINRKP